VSAELKTKSAAIIGAATSSGGLIAVCVFESKPTVYLPLINESNEGSETIVLYRKADSFSDGRSSHIAWNIATSGGEVYCWIVPCAYPEEEGNPNLESIQLSHSDLNLKQHPAIGELCHLGSSSLWMNGASTSENEVAIGQYFAAQDSRKLAVANRSISSLHVTNCIVGPPPFTPRLYMAFLSIAIGDRQVSSSHEVRGKNSHL
jgi:hypothetical protein